MGVGENRESFAPRVSLFFCPLEVFNNIDWLFLYFFHDEICILFVWKELFSSPVMAKTVCKFLEIFV